MSTFNDNEHPRVADGTFTAKPQTTPEIPALTSRSTFQIFVGRADASAIGGQGQVYTATGSRGTVHFPIEEYDDLVAAGEAAYAADANGELADEPTFIDVPARSKITQLMPRNIRVGYVLTNLNGQGEVIVTIEPHRFHYDTFVVNGRVQLAGDAKYPVVKA